MNTDFKWKLTSIQAKVTSSSDAMLNNPSFNIIIRSTLLKVNSLLKISYMTKYTCVLITFSSISFVFIGSLRQISTSLRYIHISGTIFTRWSHIPLSCFCLGLLLINIWIIRLLYLKATWGPACWIMLSKIVKLSVTWRVKHLVNSEGFESLLLLLDFLASKWGDAMNHSE